MKNKNNKVLFTDDKSLYIQYANYGDDGNNYGELFDWLGDKDIITASELGNDMIVHDGDVYLFTHQDEHILKREGSVTLKKEGTINEFDTDGSFSKWYYNN